MMVRPWANAMATIPGRPRPSPTTAAVPAPMNTNAKVPMNSASNFDGIWLDIANSQRCDQVSPRNNALVEDGWRHDECHQPSNLFRGEPRPEIDAQRLRHAGSVCRICARAVVDVTLLDVQPRIAHCPRRVVEQQLLLLRGHLPEQISGLLPMVVV